MKVTLDTNILVQDFWFNSTYLKVFLDELNIIPATLHIPEIVIDETVNKYRENLTEKVAELNKTNSTISKLLNKEVAYKPIDIIKATKNYEKFLMNKLKEVKAQILPYPEVPHKYIVKSILERRRPFKKGDAGYRDFLIWQTIKKLEAWGTEEIVFLTHNTKDFGESGFLSDEYTDKTTGNKNFKISTAVSTFNDEYILPRLKKLEELKKQLIKGQVKNFNFKKWLDTDFVKLIKERNLDILLTGFPVGVGMTQITEVIFYDDFKVEEVNQLDSGEKLVHFSVKCKVNASIHIDWDDYIEYKEVREYYGEVDEAFSYSYGMASEEINVEGYLILDKQNEEVNNIEIKKIEGPYGTEIRV